MHSDRSGDLVFSLSSPNSFAYCGLSSSLLTYGDENIAHEAIYLLNEKMLFTPPV